MITVFGGWPTRAFRVVWALEELALPYRLHPVDLRARREDAELTALNPAGFLPVLRDEGEDDGGAGGVVMVESIAILQYLAARRDPEGRLSPPAASPDLPAYLQFLHLGEAGLAAPLNVVVASRLFAPEADRENFGARAAVGMVLNRLGLVSARLALAPFLAGEGFTAADISVGYALDMAARLGLAPRFGAEIEAYRARLSARPAYRAAEAELPETSFFDRDG